MDWLTTDRRFPDEPRFAGLRAIAVVEAEVERNGSISLEQRYYLSSMPLDAKLFAHAVRCHWHVENRLHWMLDVIFHEDLSRLRARPTPDGVPVTITSPGSSVHASLRVLTRVATSNARSSVEASCTIAPFSRVCSRNPAQPGGSASAVTSQGPHRGADHRQAT